MNVLRHISGAFGRFGKIARISLVVADCSSTAVAMVPEMSFQVHIHADRCVSIFFRFYWHSILGRFTSWLCFNGICGDMRFVWGDWLRSDLWLRNGNNFLWGFESLWRSWQRHFAGLLHLL